MIGTTIGAMCGAGIMMESIHGPEGPTPCLHWGTALGALAGGILGVIEMGQTIYRALPEYWREQVRLGFGPFTGPLWPR
jgi:hypothetical protein